MTQRWQTRSQPRFVKLARRSFVGLVGALVASLVVSSQAIRANEPGVVVIVDAAADGGATGAVRIGINVAPVDADVRTRLNVPEKIDGLVVRYVHPGGPAAKADLRVDDVIVHAGDKVIDTLESLIAAVQASEDVDLSVQVWRGGELKSLKMRPTVWVNPGWTFNFGPPGEWKQMLPPNWRPGPGANLPWPLPGAGLQVGALPKDMSISITHKGDGPSQIVVHRGDKKYETTFEKLRELPPDVQPHVRAFLMQLAVRGSIAMMPRPQVLPLPEPKATPEKSAAPESKDADAKDAAKKDTDKKDAAKKDVPKKDADKPQSREPAVPQTQPSVEPRSPVDKKPDSQPEPKSKSKPKSAPKPDAKVEKNPLPLPTPKVEAKTAKKPEPPVEKKVEVQPAAKSDARANPAAELLEGAVKQQLLPQLERLANQIERLSDRVAELEKRLQRACQQCPIEKRPADSRTSNESRPAPRRRAKTADQK